MLLQSWIIGLVGAVAIISGIVANTRFLSPLVGVLVGMFLIIAVYFTIYYLECLVSGRCGFTSWYTAGLALLTYGGLASVYIYALWTGSGLPGLQDQGFIRSNATVEKVNGWLIDKFNVDVFAYLQPLPSSNEKN
jgi:hypothetical protein